MIAYDVWAFWLGLFAADVTELWKQASADREGLPSAVEQHGQTYCPGRGTLFAALPLLRSPMGLFASRDVVKDVLAPTAAEPGWTWDGVSGAMGTAPFSIRTDVFSVDAADGAFTVGQRSMAAEGSAALIAAWDGRLASASVAGATPSVTSAAALTALEAFVALRLAGHVPASELDVVYPTNYIAPAYLWEPLGGGALSVYARNYGGGGAQVGGVFHPWPAGPSLRAVPASYLCAYLWQGSPHLQEAGDFCTFLLSPDAQVALAQAGGGFALRASDAVKQLPYVGTRVARPADALDASTDLTLADLYGGWKTDQNEAAIDEMADSFVAALSPVNAALPAAGDLSALVRKAYGP